MQHRPKVTNMKNQPKMAKIIQKYKIIQLIHNPLMQKKQIKQHRIMGLGPLQLQFQQQMLSYKSTNQVNVIRSKYASAQANKFTSKSPIKDFKIAIVKQFQNKQNKTQDQLSNNKYQHHDVRRTDSKTVERTGKICKNKCKKNIENGINTNRQSYFGMERSANSSKQPERMLKNMKQNKINSCEKFSHVNGLNSERNAEKIGLNRAINSARESTSINIKGTNKLNVESLKCIQNVEKVQIKIKQILRQK